MRSHRVLPPDDVIRELFVTNNLSPAEIAEMYGVKAKSVNHHIHRMGLREQLQPGQLDKNTFDVVMYVAKKANTTPSKIIQALLDVVLDNHMDELKRELGAV